MKPNTKKQLDRAIVIGIVIYYTFIFCKDYRDYRLSRETYSLSTPKGLSKAVDWLSEVVPSINIEDRRHEAQ